MSVGETDSSLIGGFNSSFERLFQHSKSENCNKTCQKCMWKAKKFKKSSINITTNKKGDKFVISESGKSEIKSRFEALLTSKKPHVLIFASCFSHLSEINHTLRASGLYSCLLVSTERSEITLGKVCHLDKEQQELLEAVTEVDEENGQFLLKDVILSG